MGVIFIRHSGSALMEETMPLNNYKSLFQYKKINLLYDKILKILGNILGVQLL